MNTDRNILWCTLELYISPAPILPLYENAREDIPNRIELMIQPAWPLSAEKVTGHLTHEHGHFMPDHFLRTAIVSAVAGFGMLEIFSCLDVLVSAYRPVDHELFFSLSQAAGTACLRPHCGSKLQESICIR